MAKTRQAARSIRIVQEKSRRRHKKGFTLPVAVIAGFAPIAMETIQGFKDGGVTGGIHSLALYTTGYSTFDHKFSSAYLFKGMTPVVVGLIIHKLASKFGLNRMLSQSGIPIIRL